MPEPGLDSPEAARFYTEGPSFEDLAKGLSPDEKHRYTQWRASSRYRDKTPSSDPEVQRKRGEESRALLSMFTKPNSDEDALFRMLEESETDTEVENPTPLGKEYGSAYASKEAAAARMTPMARTATPAKSYTDLNSRPVGFSERTFMPPEGALANAAKRKLEKNRGQRR